MELKRAQLSWLKPILLDPKATAGTQRQIAAQLRKQLSQALVGQDFASSDLARCVYIIRMLGDFTIDYQRAASPVLYIGRGAAFTRLAAHLKNWLHDVRRFGQDVSIEIRICRPRRRGSPDLFKYVEADLIAMFSKRYGCIPFFNRRRERGFENRTSYALTDEKLFSAAISIGRGKRPQWAIAPMPANKNYGTFYTGWNLK